MRTWIPRVARVWPFLLSGAFLTLLASWGLPLLLAARSIGPADAPASIWHDAPESGVWRDGAPMFTVRRSAFSDWYIAEPASDLVGALQWPVGALEDANGAHRSVPWAVVASPPEGEGAAWGRIDTGLAGWPFRCFASEAWFLRTSTGYEPDPEFRGNLHLGIIEGRHLLIPLRPIIAGLLLDLLFWATVSWIGLAGPREFRRRRRAKYGRCRECGYEIGRFDVKRPERCPECGAPFIVDPLAFAHVPEMHYQSAYVWIVFVSSLDIMLTAKILGKGGTEVNPVAAMVIDMWGMQGAIAFKFALMTWVILVCELLARLRHRAGWLLAAFAIALSSMPVAWSLFLLLVHTFRPTT